MKFKENKKKKYFIIIGTILLCFYFAFIKGIYAFSDRIIGPYVNAESYKEFLDCDSWQIGENKYGEPIFCYPNNAFQYTKRKYADLINRIYDLYHDQYKLKKLNKYNFVTYRGLAEQLSLTAKDQKECDDCISLIRLLDLYENGQKRWIYVIGDGFNRIYKK